MDMNDPVDVVARTIWGEARGEGPDGMNAVACVIKNRYTHPTWWGHTLIEICTKPYQFSCWLDSDPNKQKLLTVDNTDPQFNTALHIAEMVVDNSLCDVTNGATHYKVSSLPWPRAWGPPKEPLVVIGHQSFYKL